MFITTYAAYIILYAYKKRKDGKGEEEYKYKYGWIYGKGEIFFYHHLYKSVNVGIIIYRSGKNGMSYGLRYKDSERLRTYIYVYTQTHTYTYVLHDVNILHL